MFKAVPRRDFAKLPCKRCKLRTEHVRVAAALSDGAYLYICLRCRTSRSEKEVASDFMKEEMLGLPEDDREPAGVA